MSISFIFSWVRWLQVLLLLEANSSLALFIPKAANSNVEGGAKWGPLTVWKRRVRSAIWEESLRSPDLLVCQGKQNYLDFNMTYSDFQRLATNSNFSTLWRPNSTYPRAIFSLQVLKWWPQLYIPKAKQLEEELGGEGKKDQALGICSVEWKLGKKEMLKGKF